MIREAERFSNGTPYLNFVGDDAADRSVVEAAFGDNLDRLARVKATYDPGNRFRLNNNIEPAS